MKSKALFITAALLVGCFAKADLVVASGKIQSRISVQTDDHLYSVLTLDRGAISLGSPCYGLHGDGLYLAMGTEQSINVNFNNTTIIYFVNNAICESAKMSLQTLKPGDSIVVSDEAVTINNQVFPLQHN